MSYPVTVWLSGLFAALVAVLVIAGGTIPALANNIPGSAAMAVPQETQIATEMVVRSLKAHVVPLRDGTGGTTASVSRSGRLAGASFAAASRTGIAFSVDYRDLDTRRLDGSLGVGTVFLGHMIDARTMVFGGFVAERLGADTPYNSGRIDANGFGVALGLDYRLDESLFLTGIVGLMGMDYDVSRGNGAFTGSFDARRSFIDLSGDYIFRIAPAEIALGFGLLYVNQKNDGYAESGGAAVAGFTSRQLSGRLSARSTWGPRSGLRPYAEAETWFRLSGSSGLPALLDPDDKRDWTGRLRVGLQRASAGSGFDVGLGPNFGRDGYEGLDGRFSFTHRF